MGIYLNPGNDRFQMSLNSKIYVDKSNLISYTNSVINTAQRFVCVSRPRRFGKSVTAEMLAAYYGKDIDSSEQFGSLSISRDRSYREHLNGYNVIFLNIQQFLGQARDISDLKELIEKTLLWELLEEYPDLHYFDSSALIFVLQTISAKLSKGFIFIIDEWDCIFREYKDAMLSLLKSIRAICFLSVSAMILKARSIIVLSSSIIKMNKKSKIPETAASGILKRRQPDLNW